jgi:GNAT superfamily N-acetyltransferase
MAEAKLQRYLSGWLGRWPAADGALDVVASRRREEPGWDARVHPAIGVLTPDSGVLSVGPRHLAAARSVAGQGSLDLLSEALPAIVDRPHHRAYLAVFRWAVSPSPLPDLGIWLPAQHPAVPPWLQVFGHEVLVALDPDTGAYLAGVGIKRHDDHGRELAVGTAPEARGRGLARRLVAQAARRVLDEGAVPTYLHDPANVASARVAEAAGFPDRGWRFIGIGERPTTSP